MKKIALFVMVVFLLVLVSGCMSTYTTTDGRLNYGNISGAEKGEFFATDGYMYIIHPTLVALGDLPSEQIDLVIADELTAQDANAAKDLVIRDGFTFMDYLLTAIVPLVSWGTVEVEGTAVSQ